MKIKFVKSIFSQLDGKPFRKRVGDVVDLKESYAIHFVNAGMAESLEIKPEPAKKSTKAKVEKVVEEPVVEKVEVVEEVVESYAVSEQ